MKKNKATKLGIIVAVLLLAVGFAAVSTTLFINGTAVIKPDGEDFEKNIIFTKAEVDDEGASATISDDGKTITYTTQVLNTIGQSSTLTYQISNNSQYDALIGKIVCTPDADEEAENGKKNATDFNNYLTLSYDGVITATSADLALAKGSHTDDAMLTVTLKRSYVGDTAKTITYNCTIPATAVEAN